jgi:RNA polymerase sigma-70 factor (ECF subfamily)
MTAPEEDTDALLDRAAGGEDAARQQLLARHRDRLRQMIVVRLDRRLAARLDPSDVVQEVLVDAYRKLDEYLRSRPLPFYPWLRRLAWERLVKLKQHHLRGKRSVFREEPPAPALSDESVQELANRLAGGGPSPSDLAVRAELRRRVGEALDRLGERDRELLILRYLEQLSTREIAAVLGMTEGAVKTRHVRALERLRRHLGEEEGEP